MLRLFFLFTISCSFVVPAAPADVVLPTGVAGDRLATELVWSTVRRMPVGRRPRVVLVMGGGGARGLSHIGVLRVLEEENIPVDEIVGVSVGALIGALYAAGLPVDKIEAMARDVGWNQLTDFSKVSFLRMILTESLFSTTRMETYLNRHIGEKHFVDLKIPFTCVATDLRTGERVVLDEGPVALAARASATIPGIFEPVQYRQRYLVDGGLVDNLPTDLPVVTDFDIVVAVLPKVDERRDDVPNVFMVLVRSIEIQKEVILGAKKKNADFVIEPDVGAMSLIDLGRTKEAIEAGTATARRQALDLKALIISRTMSQNGQQSRSRTTP